MFRHGSRWSPFFLPCRKNQRSRWELMNLAGGREREKKGRERGRGREGRERVESKRKGEKGGVLRLRSEERK